MASSFKKVFWRGYRRTKKTMLMLFNELYHKNDAHIIGYLFTNSTTTDQKEAIGTVRGVCGLYNLIYWSTVSKTGIYPIFHYGVSRNLRHHVYCLHIWLFKTLSWILDQPNRCRVANSKRSLNQYVKKRVIFLEFFAHFLFNALFASCVEQNVNKSSWYEMGGIFWGKFLHKSCNWPLQMALPDFWPYKMKKSGKSGPLKWI